MGKKITQSVIMRRDRCESGSADESFELLRLLGDGSVTRWYQASLFQQPVEEAEVDRDKAIKELKDRISQLRYEREYLLDNLHEAEKMLKFLKGQTNT